MIDTQTLDELSERLLKALPAGALQLKDDMRKSLRVVLQDALSKMDLVSRQEFDIQSAVLARTREKLDALEAQVAALEQANSR